MIFKLKSKYSVHRVYIQRWSLDYTQYGQRQGQRRSKAGAVSAVEHSCGGKQEVSLVQKGQRYKEHNEEEYKQKSGVS